MIYLTLFGVTRNFGSYKYLLLLFPSFGIFFATLEIILYPYVYSHYAGHILYSTHRPFNLSKEVVTWLLAFYTGVYGSTISILAVQFLYRYWAIFRDTNLSYFNGWRLLLWILYSLIFGIQYACGLYYFERIDDYTKHYLEHDMMQKFNIDFSEIAGMALVAFDPDGSVRWWNVSCTLNITSVLFIQYTIIIYCALRMYIEMESKIAILSPSLRNLHKQFFKTLVLQIVCPTIILFFPVLLIIYLPLLDLEMDVPSGIFLCAFTLYPAMDAMIVMYVVKDYKKAALNMFQSWSKMLCRFRTATESTTTTTTGEGTGRAQALAVLG